MKLLNSNEFSEYLQYRNIDTDIDLDDLDDINKINQDYIKLAKLFLDCYVRLRSDFVDCNEVYWIFSNDIDGYLTIFENLNNSYSYINKSKIYNISNDIDKFVGDNYFKIIDFINFFKGVYE